jgi:hypothetical protein
MAISSDANIVAIAKTYYTDKKFESLFARNDAFCRIVDKNRVGGKEYRFGTKVYQGGNVAGNYSQLLTNFSSSTSGYGGVSGINAEFVVTPGSIFTVFQITQLEELATRTDRQAYVKAVVSKFYDATEGLRKAFATAAYGTGYGEVGQINSAILYTPAQWAAGSAGTPVNGTNAFTAGTSMWLQLFQADGVTPQWDALVKLSIGSLIQFTSGTVPSGSFVGAATIYVIQSIQGNAIQIANAAGGNVPTDVIPVGSWIELNGCYSAATTPNYLFPVGMAGWLPTLGTGRANNSSAWQTYIGTSFFGVTRSVAPDRLAGNFYKRGSEKRGDALIEGVRMARRGGGEPNLIIMNDMDYRQILQDFNAQTSYMQQINTAGKASSNEFQKGLMDMGFQFSTNWLSMVYDSPYCPFGTSYILDMDTIEFAGWSNSKTPIEDTIQGNDPGAELVDSIGDLDLNFKLLIEDYLNVVPGSSTIQGPAALVTLSLFGQWCFHNPAHCSVVQF